MDTVSREKRSLIMARVRSRGNQSTELALARAFRKNQVRGWRRHKAISLGQAGGFVRPDFVFVAERVAVFVDGCLWHGCPKHARIPSSNRRYWVAKVRRNVKRDRAKDRLLRSLNWRVIHIWEHSVSKAKCRSVQRVQALLAGTAEWQPKATETPHARGVGNRKG